jgi:hypothetical protein
MYISVPQLKQGVYLEGSSSHSVIRIHYRGVAKNVVAEDFILIIKNLIFSFVHSVLVLIVVSIV